MSGKLLSLTRPEAFEPEGIPFKTTNAARWAFRKRHENGLAGAFVKIGKNLYIDVPKFHELVRQRAV